MILCKICSNSLIDVYSDLQEFGWLSADREETEVVPNTISVPLKSISSSLIKVTTTQNQILSDDKYYNL